jgi:hypothetical protein
MIVAKTTEQRKKALANITNAEERFYWYI